MKRPIFKRDKEVTTFFYLHNNNKLFFSLQIIMVEPWTDGQQRQLTKKTKARKKKIEKLQETKRKKAQLVAEKNLIILMNNL